MTSGAGGDPEEWEKRIIEQLVEMFRGMGMDVGASDLRRMMEQIQQQFESLGIDPEKIARGDVKFNLQTDFGDLSEMFSGGAPPDLAEMMSRFGVDVRMGGPEGDSSPSTETEEVAVVEVEEAEESAEDAVSDIPDADVYLSGWNMHITIDISRHEDLDTGELEVNLSSTGDTLELMRFSQLRPFQSYALPQTATEVGEWELNNGILDITLTLKAPDEEPAAVNE